MFGIFVLLILLVGIGGPLLLYALVQSETSGGEVMDRADAERAVRNDTDDGDRRR